MKRALALSLCLAASVFAASRARYGGSATVALPHPSEADPALADSPGEAAMASLLAPSICTLLGDRVVPRLGALRWDDPLHLRVALSVDERRTAAPDLVASWQRLLRAPTLSPYRALLAPLRDDGRTLTAADAASDVPLTLSYPAPDWERALCHPALGARSQRPLAAIGPFGPDPHGLQSNPRFFAGRPYLERLRLMSATDRLAQRALGNGQAQLWLGGVDALGAQAPQLFATYLLYSPKLQSIRPVLDASIDRADLVRFFARAPASALSGLIPGASSVTTMKPVPAAGMPELTLYFDASLEDQRAVAERLQVRLHDRGVHVSLRPLPRADLRSRWAAGDFDLMLQSVLLPPVAPFALALALEVAGRHELIATELPAIEAIADRAQRDARAIERANALGSGLPLVPLYVQGPRAQAAPRVQNLGFDAFGVPQLDAMFLGDGR